MYSVLPRAIQLSEFRHGFNRAWFQRDKTLPLKLGLAISGGVDSVALAYLCSKLLRRDCPESQCQAFIVNHNSRAGSRAEAQEVAERLRRELGISASILDLQWLHDGDQFKNPLSNFETVARKLRYRALGTACKEHGITALMLGHHLDDQAETVLVRLSNGHNVIGLQGIRSSNDIPECWGICGVHRSREDGHVSQRPAGRTAVGGVSIYRPLLAFPKDRLRATCEQAGLGWVEDESNKDITLTPRNAARNLLVSGNLPAALRTDSIIKVMERSTRYVHRLESLTYKLFELCDFDPLRLATGTISFVPPTRNDIESLSPGTTTAEMLYVLRNLLAQITEAISPADSVQVMGFDSAVSAIFPWILPPPSARDVKSAFTISGVKFERTESAGRTLWFLCRAPLSSSLQLPEHTVEAKHRQAGPAEETFLWDGRYWIRIANHTALPLCVRPLRNGELDAFVKSVRRLRQGKKQFLEHTLPANVRRTVPVIAVSDDARQHAAQIIAMPSIGVVADKWQDSVFWNITYKKIARHGHGTWWKGSEGGKHGTKENDSFIRRVSTRDDEGVAYQAVRQRPD